MGSVGGFSCEEEYLGFDLKPGQTLSSVDPAILTARRQFWANMQPLHFGVTSSAPGTSEFGHLGTTREQMSMLRGEMDVFVEPFGLRPRVLAHCGGDDSGVASDAVVINSFLGNGTVGNCAVVEHCDLSSPAVAYRIGEHSMVSGLRGLVGAVTQSSSGGGGGLRGGNVGGGSGSTGAGGLPVGISQLVVPPHVCMQEVRPVLVLLCAPCALCSLPCRSTLHDLAPLNACSARVSPVRL